MSKLAEYESVKAQIREIASDLRMDPVPTMQQWKNVRLSPLLAVPKSKKMETWTGNLIT